MLNAVPVWSYTCQTGKGRGIDVWLFFLINLLWGLVAERVVAFRPHVDTKSVLQELEVGGNGAWRLGHGGALCSAVAGIA